jgi:TolB-like protein
VTRVSDIFLSYSREDQATVRRYAEALEREGFKVWWDAALNPGETFDQVTEQALRGAGAVVVLWSKHSVTSRWVRSEATQADRFGTLVPVMIEACDRPILFELAHTTDLSRWKGDRDTEEWRSFVASLRRLVDRSGASGPAASLAPAADTYAGRDAAPSPRTRQGPIAWAAIAAAIAVGAGLYWYLSDREASAPAIAAGATKSAALASVAVLPFRDMSQNKDQEYFADGVTEEILNSLAGLKDLKVTARTSAFAFKGKDVDLRKVGETLGVQHILEGSIRKDGDNLRITAQLIDTKSDAHVWSKTYDQSLKDIFQVQEDIARSVAEALQVTLGVGFGKQPGMTRDVDAYDAFLAAWPLILQYNPESQRRAIGLLEMAIARDQGFGRAWVRLAGAYGGMVGLVPKDAGDWQQKADAALENALRFAPGSPGLHFELAERSIVGNRWTEAEGHYADRETAIRSLGGNVGDSGARARFLLMVGRTREALAILEQQKARDPLSPNASFYLAVAHSSIRDFPAASAEFERGQLLDPSWRFLFQVGALSNALGTRDRAELVRLLDLQIAEGPVPQREFNARMKALLDRPADAKAYLRARARDPANSAVSVAAVAQWLAYFGDGEAALGALRRAFESGASNPASVGSWYPVMSDVRKLPGFKQLVRDFGFVDYWRKFGWGDFCKSVGADDFECS